MNDTPTTQAPPAQAAPAGATLAPHPQPTTVEALHAEVDAANTELLNGIPVLHQQNNVALVQWLEARLTPRFEAIDRRLAGLDQRAQVPPAPTAGLAPLPPPTLPSFPVWEVDPDSPMPPIAPSYGAWSDADGWLRAAALGTMDAVATAFITAVQPSLHPGQMVALRAMVRAAMEAAAEAGRLSMPAGTFVPLLRPLVVAALSFAVTMARSNAGAVHPAFASTAVDELMALPQWSTRLADARMRDVADRLRVFPAGGPRRPTQAPTKNKGRGGRGAAAKE